MSVAQSSGATVALQSKVYTVANSLRQIKIDEPIRAMHDKAWNIFKIFHKLIDWPGQQGITAMHFNKTKTSGRIRYCNEASFPFLGVSRDRQHRGNQAMVPKGYSATDEDFLHVTSKKADAVVSLAQRKNFCVQQF